MPQLFDESLDELPVYERVESTLGMDAFTRSTQLPADVSQYLLNVYTNENFNARTRPGANTIIQSLQAKIQGLLYFDIPSAEQLIACHGGTFSFYDTVSWTGMTGYTTFDADSRVSAAQGVSKALFTDGVTEMQTWNGTAWSGGLGSGPNDPPKGASIVLWHAGRMWAAGFNGMTAGYEDDAIFGSALLEFEQGDWDKTNRSFRIGGGDGDPIAGLASLSASAQQGFVMGVLKQNSIWLVNTDPTFPFTNFSAQLGPQQLSDGIGCVGKRAFCVFGNDLLFVSPDRTIRSLARMQSAASQFAISPPLSLPMQPFMDRINWQFASLISAVKYGDLALFTVPLDAATTPDTVLVYNGRLQKWIGVWTGWTANSFEVTRFNGIHQLVFGDNVGRVRQWKDTSDAADNDTYKDDNTAIPTKIWSRSFLFGEPLNDKNALHADVRYNTSNAVPTITLVADDVEIKSWTTDVRITGPNLPIQLPFKLTPTGNRVAPRGLIGTPSFNECYLKIESERGWFSLRNLSMSAFLNTIRLSSFPNQGTSSDEEDIVPSTTADSTEVTVDSTLITVDTQ